jgi:hypothetical protein
MWRQPTGLAVLTALALGCMAGRADDANRPQDPEAGFLEFLGSVDRLADVNPNYLSQDPAKAGANPARPAAPAGPAPAPAPPPPPRQSLPPSASTGSGAPNHE